MVTKATTRASEKRIIKATVLELARMLGHGDGKTYADCVACGNPAIAGLHPGDANAFELGHDVSEYNGGEYRLGNLHALCASCNDTMGTTNMRECITLRYDIYVNYNGFRMRDPGPQGRRFEDRRNLWIAPKQ